MRIAVEYAGDGVVGDKTKVLAIVTNWRRPSNVNRIIESLAWQTVRPTIVVVDNSGGGSYGPYGFCHTSVDDIWTFDTNHGPPCRWAPALMDTEHRYALFIDDDLLPGKSLVESFVKAARGLQDGFTTIGAIGRNFDVACNLPKHSHRHVYRRRNVRRGINSYVKVDMTCRVHFVHTRDVVRAVQLRHDVLASQWDDPEIRDIVATHDDIFLCLGIQRAKYPQPCWLMPLGNSMHYTNLPAGRETVSARPTHTEHRTKLINYCHALGWESLR